MGMKSTGGEIVQVQGGHIVRSTGRKDRHSKVFTAKGPRDRRVRLSAHTAIQFYDVQDRLGYDRPSKAVDWLIKKAKAAIDKLAELPPWHPNSTSGAPDEAGPNVNSAEIGVGGGGGEQSESAGYENLQIHRGVSGAGANLDSTNTSSYFSTSSDTMLADTMKSLFPMSSGTSSINFSSYPQDIISRGNTNNQHQDLGLSLQSFHFPSLMNSEEPNQTTPHDHTLFASNSISAPMAFESGYPRMVAWNNNEATADSRGVGGFLFNSPIPALAAQPFVGQASVVFPQREPLQSSFSQAFRGYGDLPISTADHDKSEAMHQHQSSVFGSRFSSDGLPGFCIPVQIQLGEEHEGTASPDSGH